MGFARYNRLFAVALLFLAAVPALLRAEDDSDSSYHSSVSEVRVTFFVTDAANRPVDTIKKEDFAIVDGDTVVRQFRSLHRVDEAPLNVVLLVDASESVAARLPSIKRDVLQLLKLAEFDTDEHISVIAFSGLEPTVLCGRDCRSTEAIERLQSLKPAGATPLFDTLAFGAKFGTRRAIAGSRPILVLFSDGDDNISKFSLQEALQSANIAGAIICAVDVKRVDRKRAPSNSEGSSTLRRIAEATGGVYLEGDDASTGLLEAALDNLQHSYVVTYQAPNAAAGLRSLRILPKHDLNLRFHCRDSYYYGLSAR